jgi:hypothetical protein
VENVHGKVGVILATTLASLKYLKIKNKNKKNIMWRAFLDRELSRRNTQEILALHVPSH